MYQDTSFVLFCFVLNVGILNVQVILYWNCRGVVPGIVIISPFLSGRGACFVLFLNCEL